MKILVIEDEKKTADYLERGLTENGFVVDICSDGEDDDPISDEDFLASCRARGQSNKVRFDADALLYRKIQKLRLDFAKRIGWEATKAKVGEMGPYARRLMLFLEAKHPRDWLHCSQCVHGQTKTGICNACKGGGYILG